MPLLNIRSPEPASTKESLSTSARQLEALTALAAAPDDGCELEEVFAGLADTITRLTDYRTCLVVLFDDEAPHNARVLSYSADIPAEYVARITAGSYPRRNVMRAIERGVHVEVGGLGFAAYYPPSRYRVLEEVFPDRYKPEASGPARPHDAEAWHDGDGLFVPLSTRGGELFGLISLDNPRSGRAPDPASVLPALAFARQAAQLIARRRDAERLTEQAERVALVNVITHAIRASLNLSEVMSAATHGLGRALRASRVYVRLHDSEQPTDVPVKYEYLAHGSESMSTRLINFARPIGRYLMRTQRTLVVDDAEIFAGGHSALRAQIRETVAADGARSKIYCPLVVQGRFRGTLCIHQTDRVRRWAVDEVSLVESVAAQLATGIAQAELFEMVERAKRTWEATFDAMSDGIFIFSNERRLVRVNRAGAGLEARAPREILGVNCCDVLRAGRGEGCVVERATGMGRAVTIEYTPELLGRPLLVTAEPIFEDGAQAGTVCTVRDLTELRRIEAVARERQTLLTHILESAREAIYASDADGHLQWCNPMLARATGHEPEELIGMHFFDLMHEDDRAGAQEHFRRALAGEPQNYEMRYLTRAGHVRHALVDNAPLVIDGRTTGVLGIARDVTEQRQERERVARADKLRALGQLASGVAHDFNNSLAAILGRAQLLRRVAHDAEINRNLDIIRTAAEDAAATVRRIRSFANQTPGEQFTLLDLKALLRDAIEITRTRWENDARARGLHYEVRLECELSAYARGSASELREVFVNLIVNAVDAMPSGGSLHIGCRQRRGGGRLELTFKDTGTGMSEDVRARLFEPFYTTKGAHGTGLGLFVSYGIIERHGGHISVESERGRGTTFRIALPEAARTATPAGETGVADCRVEPLSVLVVDDEEAVRETLAEMVDVLGHRVASAAGGREALDAVEAAEFDLVFTDLSMPEMDGWELSREVRALRPATRIVVVTGYGREATPPDEATASAIDGIIGKPFDLPRIESVLRAVGRVKSLMRDEPSVLSSSLIC